MPRLTNNQSPPSPWGQFDGKVTATWTGPRDMVLEVDFAYIDPDGIRWDAPAGSRTDGASIPSPFWRIIGTTPFVGEYREAAVVHDVACDARHRRWGDVHRMFYNAMRCGGVPPEKALIMYTAVYYFGPKWGPQLDWPSVLPADWHGIVAAERPEADDWDVEQIVSLVESGRVTTLDEAERLKVERPIAEASFGDRLFVVEPNPARPHYTPLVCPVCRAPVPILDSRSPTTFVRSCPGCGHQWQSL